MLTALSFLYPCGCCATAVVLVSVRVRIIILCCSWWCHQSLPICFLLASSVPCYDLIHLFCVARPVLYMISSSAVGSACVATSMLCILEYVLMCWWHLHLNSCQSFPGPFSLHGCSRTTSPWCTSLGQVCTWCTPYIGVFSTYKPWEVVGSDISSIDNNTLLCIVDYYSTFPVVKKTDGLSADAQIGVAKIVFTEYWPSRKIVSDAGIIFLSDRCKLSCSQKNIEQAITSSCYHHSNGQVETCWRFGKHTIKKCLDNNDDIILTFCRWD